MLHPGLVGDGAWTVVGKGKAARCSGKKASPQVSQQQRLDATSVPAAEPPGWPSAAVSEPRRKRGRASASETLEQHAIRLVTMVQECRREVAASPFYAKLLSALQQASASCAGDAAEQQEYAGLGWVEEFIIYGLGSPEDSRVSRYQLALVLLLAEHHLPALSAAPRRPLAFDPVFCEVDVLLLDMLGVDVITTDEGGARRAWAQGTGGTLFYAPHCESDLYDRLLGANWGAQLLPRVTILGNSFSNYETRWSLRGASESTTATRPKKVLQLVAAGVVKELLTPDVDFPSASAFNDMGLHMFPLSGCQTFFSPQEALGQQV